MDIPEVQSEEIKEQFEKKMKEIALKEEERRARQRAKNQGFPYINLSGFPIAAEALILIPREYSEKHKVLCFLFTGRGGEFRLGAVFPEKDEITKLGTEFERKYGARKGIYLISESSFASAFLYYEKIPVRQEIVKGVKITEEELNKYHFSIKDLKQIGEQIHQVPTTDMVTITIAGALKSRSSDIHVEAEHNSIKVRYRIDGVLHDVASLEKDQWKRIVSRVKLLSGLKLNIEDRPQDGRFTIFLSKEEVDVRVSTIPTAYGESVVMRLLMSSSVALHFDDLGIRGSAFERLEREIQKPNGMIITTGPTGSGKTTTMYAILTKLNDEETKIVTLEDPIEYKLKGINQSQIDFAAGYGFAKGLRSILRQDPDVVLVGEIRDFETADTAINAALTGHLVLSTIHTNSASGAIPRFLSMGVKPFLLSPSLNAIIGQRLVRRICETCKEEDVSVDEENFAQAKKALEAIPETSQDRPQNIENLIFYRGKGCDDCQGLGYKGRVGIYEIMNMNKELNDAIAEGKVSEYDLEEIAVRFGMITMLQDGILKAMDGITTLSEVFRVAD